MHRSHKKILIWLKETKKLRKEEKELENRKKN